MAAQLRSASVTSSWVALSSLSCRNVSISNGTGAALYIRKAAETTSGHSITIPDGGSVGISVVSNAAELEISAAAAGPTSGVSYIAD
jgi:hypothetical protein